MLVIRLRRIGRKHDPRYRLVVAEHTAPVQGKFLAEIGHYNPKSKQAVIDEKAMLEWIGKGAKPSNTVAKLATKLEISHKHIVVTQKVAKKVEAPVEEAPKPAAEPEATETEVEADAAEPEVIAEEVSEPEMPAESVEESTEASEEEKTEEPKA